MLGLSRRCQRGWRFISAALSPLILPFDSEHFQSCQEKKLLVNPLRAHLGPGAGGGGGRGPDLGAVEAGMGCCEKPQGGSLDTLESGPMP